MVYSDHTAKVFDADLIELMQKVAEMGGRAQKQIIDAMDALGRSDMVLAQQVIAADGTVDELQRQIEQKAVETIALRQPMAGDLRLLVAILRIANDIEQMGIWPKTSPSAPSPWPTSSRRGPWRAAYAT